MENPWKTLSKQVAYDNPWIQVTHREVINPNGGEGIYGIVHFKNIAVGIIPVDADGNTWLVGQYRYALSEYTWEIPEGGCPIGASPLEAAQRELREETGLIANEWELLLQSNLSNSVTDERAYVYLAKGLEQGESEPDETERLDIRKLPLSEAIAMAQNGEITDSLSMLGLLRLATL